jgi:hypothetical protein
MSASASQAGAQVPAPAAALRVSAARRSGRGHVRLGAPCQDAFAVHENPQAGRVAAAVADGLGSKPLSHLGSQAACDAAVASLAAEPASPAWGRDALLRALAAGRSAVAARAAAEGLAPGDLATTLQLAVLQDGRALAAMVGDGAVVGAAGDGAGGPQVLLAPALGGYANEVVPLTAEGWQEHVRFAEADGMDAVLLFTDGLTRLLLARARGDPEPAESSAAVSGGERAAAPSPAPAWAPFAPFFDAFLPRVRGAAFDPRLAERFLQDPAVDRSWDDDKCLVVIAHGPRDLPAPGPGSPV